MKSEAQHEDTGADRRTDKTGPTLRQREVLEAYLATPVAPRVADATGMSERHVRRLVAEFGDYLEERQHARDAERLEREAARQARIQDFLDDTLDDDLRRLDELTRSSSEGVALRAIKMKIELATSTSFGTSRPRDALDDSLHGLERSVTERMDGLGIEEERS